MKKEIKRLELAKLQLKTMGNGSIRLLDPTGCNVICEFNCKGVCTYCDDELFSLEVNKSVFGERLQKLINPTKLKNVVIQRNW